MCEQRVSGVRVTYSKKKKERRINEAHSLGRDFFLLESVCTWLIEFTMHCLNAFRIRMLIILLVMFIFWQIFRNWPGADDYAVSQNKIYSQFFKTQSKLITFSICNSTEFDTCNWFSCDGNGIL